ncbi:MAG: sigma-70 family RNA polymerase sigma factor [Massiliimalia sp.]|jgi:RNA polymerase sigma factor (sigma-70 family)
MKKASFSFYENLLGTNGPDQEESTNRLQREKLKKILLCLLRDQLTDRQRQILILHFFEQKSQAEIAKILGVNRSTVCRTLNRGMHRLQNILQYYKLR